MLTVSDGRKLKRDLLAALREELRLAEEVIANHRQAVINRGPTDAFTSFTFSALTAERVLDVIRHSLLIEQAEEAPVKDIGEVAARLLAVLTKAVVDSTSEAHAVDQTPPMLVLVDAQRLAWLRVMRAVQTPLAEALGTETSATVH